MKRFNKKTAIILSVIFSILLAIGFVLSYIPMTFGTKTYVSLSGSLNISSDITGGLYGEYDIKTENASKSAIVESMAIIKDVFEENGFKNTNVYAIGNKKIRAEVSFPKGDETYSSVFSQLSNVASGAFSLRSTSELSDTSIVVQGSTHVEEVSIFTYNDTKSLSVKFNKAGQEKYKELCNATTTIYLVLGDYSQSISVSGVADYTQLTLQNSDYENLVQLEQKVKLGCMKIELNANTASINTMSASLSAGESGSAPSMKNFATSTAFVVSVSAFLVVLVIGLAVFTVKFGVYAILMLVTLLFNSYIFLGIMCILPSVEFGLSTIASLVIGTALIYAYAFAFASKVKSEYNLGKSLNASLESAYKKQIPSLLMSNITLFLSALVLCMFAFGELYSVAVVFTACTFLSLFTNLALVPLFIKICISFDGFGRKLFMLKKRDGISAEIEVNENLTEEAE